MLEKRNSASASASITSDNSNVTATTAPDSSYNSFVGNAPSTALFFLALGVGVLIAILFMFFTVRYFVRSKFGLHVYPVYRRNPEEIDNTSTTHDELHDLVIYIREHHFIRGSMIPSGMGRIRNLRSRYNRMKKLTEEEVEILFPKKTYFDWLNGGKERDVEQRDGMLHEATPEIGDVENKSEMPITTEKDITDIINKTIPENNESGSSSTPVMENIELNNLDNEVELHFSSGSCAICLEIIEDEDEVRGLLCGHVFHSECLDPWLTKRRACCPMCKRDYFYKGNKNNIHNANGNSNEVDLGNNHENNEEQDDNTRDDISFDYEAFRTDPALRAIIQELIPPSERARMILNDSSLRHLNIEERATEAANLRYGNLFKRIWWRLMGIKKKDILYMEIISIAAHDRSSLTETEVNSTTIESSANHSDTESIVNIETGATSTTVVPSHDLSPATSHILSTGTQNVSQSTVSDETRRSIAEQRV